MTDERTPEVKLICSTHINIGCRESCPLSCACETRKDDTQERFSKRMNEAAESLNEWTQDHYANVIFGDRH